MFALVFISVSLLNSSSKTNITLSDISNENLYSEENLAYNLILLKDKYLKIIASPIMVEQVNNATADAEFAKEISSKDKYLLEPIVDAQMIESLKNAFKVQSKLSEKEPANS